MYSSNSEILALVFGIVMMFVVIVVVATLPFYLLWNWIMPLLGIPNLTIIQSIGFLALLNVIFFPFTYNNNK